MAPQDWERQLRQRDLQAMAGWVRCTLVRVPGLYLSPVHDWDCGSHQAVDQQESSRRRAAIGA